MALDTSGALLEGVRIGNSSNQYLYPPRNFVQSAQNATFESIDSGSQYCVWVTGQTLGTDGLEIADPNLRFLWTRNDSIFRFDYDNANQRFFAAPGSSPTALGNIRNSPRISVQIPDLSALSVSPYRLYVGLPPEYSFNIQLVDTATFVTNPPSGTVQISTVNGQCNFSTTDVNNSLLNKKPLYLSRQSFYDRTKNSGLVATIDSNGQYEAYLSPIPGSGSYPLIKIGNRPYLTTVLYPSADSMPQPTAANTAHVSTDIGRLLISNASSYANESIYYDGSAISSVSPTQANVGTINVSSLISNVIIGTIPAFIGLTDATRYVFYARKSSVPNYYLNCVLGDSAPLVIDSGSVFINTTSGTVYISAADSSTLLSYQLRYLDSYLLIDGLVTFQIFRSALNGPGPEIVPDFVEYYRITDSTLNGGLPESPFVNLPVRFLQTSYLSLSVDQSAGGSGSFIGPLVDGSDVNANGLGYFIDYPNSRLSFSNRIDESKTLKIASSDVKLNNSPVFDRGVEATLDGQSIVPGADFDLNTAGGFVSFFESVGENNDLNRQGISGKISGTTFESSSNVFLPAHVGSYIYIASGVAAGFYAIQSVLSGTQVLFTPSCPFIGSISVDVKSTRESLVDNIWEEVIPPMSKFTLERSDSINEPFQTVPQSEYKVLASSGQITLSEPTLPGQVFRASYIAQEAANAGTSYKDVSVQEILKNKILYDVATYVPNSKQISFNSANLTILPQYGFTVNVNGLSKIYTAGDFVAPNKLNLETTLTGETVNVTYYVSENPGGLRTLNTEKSSLVIDYPTFKPGESTLSFNGDLTQKISSSSPLLVNNVTYVVNTISFNSSANQSTLTIETPVVEEYSGPFFATDALSYLDLAISSSAIASTSSTIKLTGDRSILKNRILKISGDAYYVTSAVYDASILRTTITLASPTYRNYIIPTFAYSTTSVIKPTDAFTTSKNAIVTEPFLVFKKSNVGSGELVLNSDYTFSDGGSVKLVSPLQRGDSLYSCYVARRVQPVGTVLDINYAYNIAPNETNGLIGQILKGNYDLYAPDSFYCRTATVLEYIPEVSASISSSNRSGPVTSAPPSLQIKDNGYPSLYFDEQRYNNCDLVTVRLLKYYNDLTNYYEDLISNYDGRVVGGVSGRFKFDGLPGSNKPNYAAVTNDIDDALFVYSEYQLTSFFVIESVPIYQKLYEYGNRSRLFPTRTRRNFIINSNVGADNRDAVIGNFGIKNINSMSVVNSAVTSVPFLKLDDNIVEIAFNGDPTTLMPQLSVNQPVFIHEPNGKFVKSTSISAISGSGPFSITFNDSIPVRFGSILTNNRQNFPPSWEANRFYFPDTDFNLNLETGELINTTYDFLVALNFQREIFPNELVVSSADYVNSSTSPARIPVLDGKTLNDYGFTSEPYLYRESESSLCIAEKSFLENTDNYGFTVLSSTRDRISGSQTPDLNVGEVCIFLDGPNANIPFTISNVVGYKTFDITPQLPVLDSASRSIVKSVAYASYQTVVVNLIKVLSTNLASNPTSGAMIGNVDSELRSLNNITLYMGENNNISTAVVSGVTLTDASANFTDVLNSFVYIPNGPNIGLYKITAFTPTTLTVSSISPYYSFASAGSVSYQIITKYSFMSEAGPKFLAPTIKSTKTFFDVTEAWSNNINVAGFSNRLTVVSSRIAELPSITASAELVCKSGDSLYNRRYLWISQRTDKKNGFLTMKNISQSNRIEATAKLKSDQEKKYALSSLQ